MKIEIAKSRNEKWTISTNYIEIKNFIRGYSKKLYSKKVDNLDEIDKFLEIYNLPKLNHEEVEHLNRTII